jgi:hypothetical protein
MLASCAPGVVRARPLSNITRRRQHTQRSHRHLSVTGRSTTTPSRQNHGHRAHPGNLLQIIHGAGMLENWSDIFTEHLR